MIELKKVSKDARGEIYVLLRDGIEFANLDGFNAGAPRGGHFHENAERKTVVFGELEYWSVNLEDTNREIKTVVNKDDIIDIPSNVAHLFIARTDALLFGTKEKDGEYKAITYPPYRKIVDDFLEKHKE